MRAGKETTFKIIFIFSLLLISPSVFAQTQSHPLSQIAPIDQNLDMMSKNLTNASYLNYTGGIFNGATQGIPTADIQSLAVTGAKIAAGVVTSSKLANPLGGSLNATMFYDSDNSNYYLDPAGATSLIMAGNVGIGTTNPAMKLESSGSIRVTGISSAPSSGSGLEIGYQTDIGYLESVNRTAGAYKPLYLYGNPFVFNTGKVGINTTTPQNTLNIVGDINATGTIYGTVSGAISGNATGLTCTSCVGTDELINSAVTSSKIASSAVTSTKLANPIGGSVNATMLYDSDNSAYYVDPAGSTSMATAGDIVLAHQKSVASVSGGEMYLTHTGTAGYIGVQTGNAAGAATLRFQFNSNAAQGSAGINSYEPITVIKSTEDSTIVAGDVTGDTEHRFTLYANGKMLWGPGGGTAPDTNLYRSAANFLKTDDNLAVAGNISIATTSSLQKLHIGNLGDSNTGIMFTYDDSQYRHSIENYFSGTQSANTMTFKVSDGSTTGQTTVVTLRGSGKVGINTTTPQKTLDIVGDLNVTGIIYGNITTNVNLSCTACVGTTQLANSAVTSTKIADGAITSSDLSNPLGGSVNATMYYDSDNSAYYLDPSSTGTALEIAGDIDINTHNINNVDRIYSGENRLYILNRVNSNSLEMKSGADDETGITIRSGDDASGNGLIDFSTPDAAGTAGILRLRFQAMAAQGSAGITTYENITPSTDTGVSLGTTAKRWGDVHASSLYGVYLYPNTPAGTLTMGGNIDANGYYVKGVGWLNSTKLNVSGAGYMENLTVGGPNVVNGMLGQKFIVTHPGGQGGFFSVSTLANAGDGDSEAVEFSENGIGGAGFAMVHAGGVGSPTIGSRQWTAAATSNTFTIVAIENNGPTYTQRAALTIGRDTGNIGLGDTTPTATLQVANSSAGLFTEVLKLHNSDTGSQASSVGMSFSQGYTGETNPLAKIKAYVWQTSNNGGGLDFITRNGGTGTYTTAMTIADNSDGTGLVGINTVNPKDRLNVIGNINVTSGNLTVVSGNITMRDAVGAIHFNETVLHRDGRNTTKMSGNFNVAGLLQVAGGASLWGGDINFNNRNQTYVNASHYGPANNAIIYFNNSCIIIKGPTSQLAVC